MGKGILNFTLIFVLIGGVLFTPPVKSAIQSQPLVGGSSSSQSYSNTSSATFKLQAQDAETSFVPSNVGIIGIKYLHQPGNMSTVIEIYPGTPAQKAGIRVGDRLLEVDGMNIIPLSSDEVFGVIAGRPNEMVNLKLMRCPNNYGSHLGCNAYSVDIKRMDMNQVASDQVYKVYKYGSMY